MADRDEIDEDVVEEVSTDPFSTLEKSTMRLDECKKLFHNYVKEGNNYFENDFWLTFDHQGYSIQVGRKYNGEMPSSSVPAFVRKNKITGLAHEMDQNSKYCHKYLFGVLKLVIDENGSRDIVAVFISRGQEVNSAVYGEQDTFFEWTKMDSTADATKQFVSSAFSTKEGDKFDGNTIECNKIFL